jgi:hypothetical protein
VEDWQDTLNIRLERIPIDRRAEGNIQPIGAGLHVHTDTIDRLLRRAGDGAWVLRWRKLL